MSHPSTEMVTPLSTAVETPGLTPAMTPASPEVMTPVNSSGFHEEGIDLVVTVFALAIGCFVRLHRTRRHGLGSDGDDRSITVSVFEVNSS
jgi:hypothetical protein